MRGKDPIDTIMDLIAEDESRIDTDLFHDVGRKREKGNREAVDFLRLR